jgi:hypothetical protein
MCLPIAARCLEVCGDHGVRHRAAVDERPRCLAVKLRLLDRALMRADRACELVVRKLERRA